MKHLIGKPIVFEQGDRLFDAMWQILQLLGSLVTAWSSTDAEAPKPEEYQPASPRFRTVLRLPIPDVVEYSLHNVVPIRITFRVGDLPAQFKNDTFSGPSHQISDLTDLCVSVVFVNSYEIYKPFMQKTWGNSAKEWPPTCAFARVIRNCLSHSGAIAIDQGTTGGKWRKFSYSRADDGRQVLGTEIYAVDLIYLLLDFAAELERAKAPNLASPPIAR